MSKSDAVVIELIVLRELLHFLFYLDILNELSLLQREHSKYMYARCLNFPCFINYLAACMHAFCMFYLYVSLGLSFKNGIFNSSLFELENISNFPPSFVLFYLPCIRSSPCFICSSNLAGF